MYNYTCEYIYRTEGVICTELKELTYKNAYRMERVDILTEIIELCTDLKELTLSILT